MSEKELILKYEEKIKFLEEKVKENRKQIDIKNSFHFDCRGEIDSLRQRIYAFKFLTWELIPKRNMIEIHCYNKLSNIDFTRMVYSLDELFLNLNKAHENDIFFLWVCGKEFVELTKIGDWKFNSSAIKFIFKEFWKMQIMEGKCNRK